MAQLELPSGGVAPPLIDLSRIAERDRSTVWSGAVRKNFPHLSIKVPPVLPATASISRQTIGGGELLQIRSGPTEVSYAAPKLPEMIHHISLMVQRRGSTFVAQGHHASVLSEGDMCVLDEANAFRLQGQEASECVLLRLPRAAVLSRQPKIEHIVARTLPRRDAGIRLLADMLLGLQSGVAQLTGSQQKAIIDGIIEMLGVVAPPPSAREIVDWRVRRALSFIELNLSHPGLTAGEIAHNQRISRRRLDEILKNETGQSAAEYLWARRLEQAASDLRDPTNAARSVAEIAFTRGFAASSHFARVFKQHYGMTPTQWRVIAGDMSGAPT